ncbi:hypothetical protein DRW07_17400 [Alteromonas sediminis]|uniref:Phasin family protein n=1 Tax=Alteromonas sediminis TaxID=2259342 RepID=A0A3N5XX66_9ALTE|nr:hypothetical protein [Alteromonas sediminis]RPJ65090.1 hypothetical protein DRW07_17400 [Alteromonas sediminis]
MESKQKKQSQIDQTVAQFIDAGIGVAMLPFSLVQQTFESTKDSTSAKFDELQARGEKVESELFGKIDPARQKANLANICNQVSMMLSPRASREAKLDTLSKKVDTLVELVSTLAAKKAAEAEAKPKTTTKAADDKPKTTRRKTTTASKATAASKPTATRKRTTTKRTTKTSTSGDKKES